MTPEQFADALREAGVLVVEHEGWEERARPGSWGPIGTVWHHTASNRNAGPTPTLQMCIDQILCHVVVGRDGVWHLIAWGHTWHAGFGLASVLGRFIRGEAPEGDARAYGVESTAGGMNERSLGIECENDGIGEPWPAVQLASMRRGTAAIHRLGGWPAARLIAHREWTERKIDPTGLDMHAERAIVAKLMTPEEDMPLNAQDLAAIRNVVRDELAKASDDQEGVIKALFDRRFKTLTKRFFRRDLLTEAIDK